MDIPTQSQLLDRIVDFCRRHDMAETRFGREAVNNPAFIGGLRREPPVSPTLETLNKLKDFMAEVDAEAATRAKLNAPLALPDEPDAEIEADQLPFGLAPVSTTGGSSPTCSPTSARPPRRAASGSSRSCSETDA